jgi:hypothetical protein
VTGVCRHPPLNDQQLNKACLFLLRLSEEN